jgi:hypothetical protein
VCDTKPKKQEARKNKIKQLINDKIKINSCFQQKIKITRNS